MKTFKVVPLFVAVSSALFLGGCATTAGADSAPLPEESQARETLSPQSAAQLAALADGEVSHKEYLDGFSRFESCMADQNANLVNVDTSKIVITYSYLTSDEANNLHCYGAEFAGIDSQWQFQTKDSSETVLTLQTCLRDQGLQPAETSEKVSDQIHEAGIDMADCFKE